MRVPDGRIQPIATADVSAEVARAAEGRPVNGVVNIGGPDKMSFADLAHAVVAEKGGDTPVVIDAQATYFGTRIDDSSLVTGDDGVLSSARFLDWLSASR